MVRSVTVSWSRRAIRAAILTGLLVAGGAGAASAQKPRVEIFNVDNGLPSSTINDLAQDAAGRLWIASRAGITVYDGRTFRTFSPSDGLPKGELWALEIDAEGRPWTVTRSRLTVYWLSEGRWQSLPLPEDEAGGGVANVAVTMALAGEASGIGGAAGQRVVLATTLDGLIWWDGASWHRLDAAQRQQFDRILSLAAFEDRVMVGTDRGLCQLELSGRFDCSLSARDPRLQGDIHGVFVDRAEGRPQVWLLGQDWLGTLEGETLRIVTEGFTLTSMRGGRQGAIARDHAGGVYFGSTAVGFYLDPQRRQPELLGLREGLVSEGATALLVDRESNVWVGSVRGLSKIGSRRFLSYDRDQGLLEREVTAIVEARAGELVLGHNTGLTFLGGPSTAVAPFGLPRSALSSQRVLDMAVDSDGIVWVAALTVGLLRVTPDRTWTVALPVDSLRSVEAGAGELWVATAHQLFRRVDDGFAEIDLGAAGRALENIRWLQYGDDERWYLGARGGLLVREGDAWQLARGPDQETSNVFNVLATAEGTVWVGTGGGLMRLQGRELVPVTEPGLPATSPVFLILRDPLGNIWFGTDDGVVVWDGAKSQHYSVQHGLAGRETNRGGGLVDHLGQVWIGTDQGVSVYQRHHAVKPEVPPTVELRGVEVGGELLPLDLGLELDPHQNSLSFHFDPVALSSEQPLVYRHRLEGFEEDWQGPAPVAGAEVRYTNLPPGRYRFELAAGWSQGPWSPAVSSTDIVITRPYWRQTWFYGLTLLAIGLAVGGIHVLRTQAIRARNLELEHLTEQLNDNIRERERLIDDLEAKNQELERFTYTVSHDLKSPLVTIKGFLGYLESDAKAGNIDRLRRDIDRIAGAAGKMGELLDELLELSRIGRVVHPPEDVEISELAREAVALAAGTIAAAGVEVEIAPHLPVVYGDRIRLLEVMQNLVENAVKFMGDQAEPRIEIGHRPEDPPVITVRDNGLGIEPEYRDRIFNLFERLDQQIAGTGVGLTLVRRIIEIHEGRVWVESEGAGRGSTFCFTVPAAPPPAS